MSPRRGTLRPHPGFNPNFLESLRTALGGFSGGGGTADHGALDGLADDDHAHYLKEKGSGGVALEVPEHIHQATASCGKLDHGLALNGLLDDDHTQYLKERASGGAGTEVPVHTHVALQGGLLDWDDIWSDAVHSHQTDAEGSKIDHGAALLGLLDDDHTIYFLLAGETTDAKLYSGADLLLYSDAGSTLKAAIYGDSGRGAFVSVRTPLVDTASGNLTLQPAGDLIIDPTGNDALPALGYEINLGSLQKKYLTLHCAELWVETLVAHDTIATIGGRILVGPTTELIADMSTGQGTIDVKHNEMASGDRVYLEADGKVEFMAVTSGPTGITGGYRYNVTRNLDGSGANLWYAGDAVFNTGTTGDGFIDIYSYRSVKSAAQYGPAIVGNIRNSATYNNWSEHWAVGNLNGIYGYGVTTYGVAFGKYATGDNHLTIDAANGIRFFEGLSTLIAQWNGAVMTLGQTTLEHIRITGTEVQLKDGATVYTELKAGVLVLGKTASEHVRITGTEVQFKDGATVYTELKAGALTLGHVAGGEYVKVTSAGVEMYGGGVLHVKLSSAGTLWIGDTATTERLQWDTANGLRILNASNVAVVKFPTSGNAQIIGTLVVTNPGKITFGGGAGVLDKDGMALDLPDGGYSAATTIKWVFGGAEHLELAAYRTGSSPNCNVLGNLRIIPQGTGYARFSLRVRNSADSADLGALTIHSDGNAKMYLGGLATPEFEITGGSLKISTALKALQFVDANAGIWRDGSDIKLKDPNAGTKTLSQLAGEAWPSNHAQETSTDTSASTNWMDLITLSLTMPASGQVCVVGAVTAYSTESADARIRILIGASGGGEMYTQIGGGQKQIMSANYRASRGTGAVTVKLQGRRASGNENLLFSYKQLIAWAMPA